MKNTWSGVSIGYYFSQKKIDIYQDNSKKKIKLNNITNKARTNTNQYLSIIHAKTHEGGQDT